ncbi:MAG: alpha/beta hydrolase fold domain-containing protein [Granulosicoccus sp.]
MTQTATPSDYTRLIDSQTHAFIQRTEAAYPENAATLDIQQQRALYDDMCHEFHAGYPAGVISHDTFVASTDGGPIPTRRYEPPARIRADDAAQIIYVHGGGFVVGGLSSHDDVCAEICARTGLALTAVDYRLSPEHKHPAALDDTMKVIDVVSQFHQQPIVLCGDSAGANLAAAACHAYRARAASMQIIPKLIGQVLIYPGLGGDTLQGSYLTHAMSPMLTTEDVHFYSNARCASDTDVLDPLFAPLQDIDFSDLPPTVVFSAECDPLCDDGEHYCQHIRLAEGKAHWVLERGLVHGYLRARHSVDRAARSFDRMIEAIVSMTEHRWPY